METATRWLKTMIFRLGRGLVPGVVAAAMLIMASPAFGGGTWVPVTAAGLPASAPGLCNPLLLTDGSVIAQGCVSPKWYKLTPDKKGNYVNGTWSTIAALPNPPGSGGYGPEWFASAVLPDGRVIVEGGEYNISCPAPPGGWPPGEGGQTWTSLGAIYNPVANTWKYVPPPSGAAWVNTKMCGTVQYDGGIGDAPSIVLPNGRFMLGACCGDPAVNALLDAASLTWTGTGAPTNQCQPPAEANGWCTAGTAFQEEQGYTLLPNDKIMTISVWEPPKAQVYDPGTGKWSAIAPAPVTLPDAAACGTYEIGPALARPDGTVVAFGGHSGCSKTPVSPTAIYTVSSNSWVAGPDVPAVCGAGLFCTTADTPAAMLPNGNILFAAGPPFGNPPTQFFVFTSATSVKPDAIEAVASPLTAGLTGAGFYNLLVLPSGNIFATDQTNQAEVFMPSGGPSQDWRPDITSAPHCVSPGGTYSLAGHQLNGRSQGMAYGDDVQGATNYPLVRIVNPATGHVFYARTFGFSTMSIAPGKSGSTKFTVAAATEIGFSSLYVVANGIASVAQDILVATTCPAG